jgi:hypothetical protein
MRINATEGSSPIILRGTPLEERNSYTYLGNLDVTREATNSFYMR